MMRPLRSDLVSAVRFGLLGGLGLPLLILAVQHLSGRFGHGTTDAFADNLTWFVWPVHFFRISFADGEERYVALATAILLNVVLYSAVGFVSSWLSYRPIAQRSFLAILFFGTICWTLAIGAFSVGAFLVFAFLFALVCLVVELRRS